MSYGRDELAEKGVGSWDQASGDDLMGWSWKSLARAPGRAVHKVYAWRDEKKYGRLYDAKKYPVGTQIVNRRGDVLFTNKKIQYKSGAVQQWALPHVFDRGRSRVRAKNVSLKTPLSSSRRDPLTGRMGAASSEERGAMQRDGASPYLTSPEDPNYEVRSSDIVIDENDDQMFGEGDFIGLSLKSLNPFRSKGKKYPAGDYAPGAQIVNRKGIVLFVNHKASAGSNWRQFWARPGKSSGRYVVRAKNVTVIMVPGGGKATKVKGDGFVGQEESNAEDMIASILELPGALMKMPEAVLGAICGGNVVEKHGRGIDILIRRR